MRSTRPGSTRFEAPAMSFEAPPPKPSAGIPRFDPPRSPAPTVLPVSRASDVDTAHGFGRWWLSLGTGVLCASIALSFAGCATSPRAQPTAKPPTTMLSQFDYPKDQLGTGRYTIGSSGCLLTSLTMASAILGGRRDLDPLEANEVVLARRGFKGSALELEIAAPALGLAITRRCVLRDRNRREAQSKLDAELALGRPVVAGVDIVPGRASSGKSGADHFIVIHQLAGDRYLCMDPAGGVATSFECDAQGVLRQTGASDRFLSELIFLDKRK
jgi:hypothetical protein